ncbi:spermidine synthase [Pholiota conissans]|uniref:Spermidine synthase n=1 Tax=Pholiota conissans TaxID=109636 RepID=A0A9P5Z5S8_9AGAR|nr:spermidine synthase [Pholiota conissans]
MSPNLLSYSRQITQFILVSSVLSLVIFTHERTLVPLYGSGPTSSWLNETILGFILASAVQPIDIPQKWSLLATALALTLSPNATYWIGVWTSRHKDPALGPAITHMAALGPVVFLLGTSLVQIKVSNLQGVKKIGWGYIASKLARGNLAFIAANLAKKHFLSTSSGLYSISDSQIVLTCAPIFYTWWIFSLSFLEATSKKALKVQKSQAKIDDVPTTSDLQIKSYIFMVFTFIWIIIKPHLVNPILPHPLSEPYTHPTYPLRILSAEQSVTGLVTVADWLPPPDGNENEQQLHSARYLRASHSILGGVWTHDKVGILDNDPPLKDSFGTPLGDSIYSTFIIQEAARLINSTEVGQSNSWKNALVIGLGTGISTTSFMRHGIATTIVEIDPAVYKAARTYFSLPKSENVFLEDARTWVAKQRGSVEAGNKTARFDIVVHDCFSGGGVPQHIFTTEFWDDLKTVMAPEGILVVNFAGVVKSKSSLLVIGTLEKNFKHCRAFHDMFNTLEEDKYETEFINMVLFCTQSSSSITFRKSRRSDWLGSPLRRHVLKDIESREINLDLIREVGGDDQYVLTDENNPLGALQEKQGAHHWLVMREVLPDIHWETY